MFLGVLFWVFVLLGVLLSFQDLVVWFIWKILSHYFFRYFFCSVLSVSSSIPITFVSFFKRL